MWAMSFRPLSLAARLASLGISMPNISRAGETMRHLMPRTSPRCCSTALRVPSKSMALSAMMSGVVARPVWQMCISGMISVWQLGMMCRGMAAKVAQRRFPRPPWW